MNFRMILPFVALVLALALGVTALLSAPGGVPGPRATGEAAIGGPFSLTAADGRTVTPDDLKGRPTILFFGFTHCPDICPAMLETVASALEQLGPDADRVNAVFVSVDPERDTPQVAQAYADFFDARILALSGSAAAVAEAAASYRIYFRKVEIPGGYTVDHSTYAYLLGADGKYVTHFNHGETPGRMADAVRGALAS